MKTWLDTLKEEAKRLKSNIYALYLASRHPQTPLLAKIIIVLVVAYALSPIDLIPDFIPVIGYLDDLLLLPLGIMLAIRLIPKELWHRCLEEARAHTDRRLPRSYIAATVIAVIWLSAAVGVYLIFSQDKR